MNRRVVAVSIILLIVCALIGFWLTAGRSGRRTYQEYVALDGIGPAELIDPPNGTDAVILYRIGRNRVVCYDVFWSKRLHDQLAAKKGQAVAVVYDTIGDRGEGHGYRGYNVQSVDGIKLENGEEGGAGVAVDNRRGDGALRAGPEDCW